MVRDDDDEPGENDGSSRATSVESQLGPAPPQDPPSREQTETHARLSSNTPEPTTELVDRRTPPNTALPQQPYMRDGGEDDRVAVAVAITPSVSPSPLSQPSPSPSPTPALEEQWEIAEIIGIRRAGKGYEYEVRWKNTWLRESELGNARRLLQKFKARDRVQRGFTARKVIRTRKAR